MLVGRGPELALLAELLADDRPAVVVGEAGVGKTALLRAVAEASGRPVFEGGALATLSWMDALPLQRALGLPLVDGDATTLVAQVEEYVGAGVLLLDDLQWADAITMEAVGQFAGRLGLLAGVRRGDPHAATVLDRMREAAFVQIDLAPLGPAESAALLEEIRPAIPPLIVERLIARTGGNPLLLRELAATGEPSASLRLALAARLRLLDAVGRDAFGMLALAGRPVSTDDLGREGAKSLLDADLAIAGSAGIEIRHNLLGEVALQQMDPAEKRALHARIARLIADDAEASRHYALAGESNLAYAAALRAAESTARPGERASHLALAAACATGPAADSLCLRAAHAQEEAHDWAGMVATLERVSSADSEALAWAALLRARGAWAEGDVEALRSALRDGLALVDGTGSEVEVRLRIEAARIPIFVDGLLEEGTRTAEQALALAQRTGFGMPRAEYFYGTSLLVADLPHCEEHLLQAMAGARAEGDLNTELLAAHNLISYHESGGSPQRARAIAVEVIQRSHTAGLGLWERAFRVSLAGLDFHAGNYREVLSTAEELLSQPLEARGRVWLLEQYCLSLVDLGRIDEAVRRIGDERGNLSAVYRATWALTWVLVEAALWGGRPAHALELVGPFLQGQPSDPNIILGLVSRGWARIDLGQDPGPGTPEQVRPMLYAVVPETAALRLLFEEKPLQAAEAFDEASRLWAPYHRRGELRCGWAAAEAVRRSGDTAQAIARLEVIEQQALEHGMLPLLTRVHRSLRTAGVPRSAPRSSGGRNALTGRERTVLALVGEGLTNSEIAGRLGLSRHTIVSQLASSSAKLGATTRNQVAALAAARTPVG